MKDMSRLKCDKCGNVFEYTHKPLDSIVHLGPIRMLKCPACGRRSFFNTLSSVKDPVTWPPEERMDKSTDLSLSEEEFKKKRIDESKYEEIEQ